MRLLPAPAASARSRNVRFPRHDDVRGDSEAHRRVGADGRRRNGQVLAGDADGVHEPEGDAIDAGRQRLDPVRAVGGVETARAADSAGPLASTVTPGSAPPVPSRTRPIDRARAGRGLFPRGEEGERERRRRGEGAASAGRSGRVGRIRLGPIPLRSSRPKGSVRKADLSGNGRRTTSSQRPDSRRESVSVQPSGPSPFTTSRTDASLRCSVVAGEDEVLALEPPRQPQDPGEDARHGVQEVDTSHGVPADRARALNAAHRPAPVVAEEEGQAARAGLDRTRQVALRARKPSVLTALVPARLPPGLLAAPRADQRLQARQLLRGSGKRRGSRSAPRLLFRRGLPGFSRGLPGFSCAMRRERPEQSDHQRRNGRAA